MKSLLERILGAPDVEVVDEEPRRYCARVAIQENEETDPGCAVSLIDEDSGYDPYDKKMVPDR